MSKSSHPSVLERLTIPTPCSENWDSMTGNDEVRFCHHCALSVHNLSEMTRSEALSLVKKSEGRLCIRYYRRPDGLIQTASDNLHSIKRRASRLVAGAFTATLSLAASVVAQTPIPAAPSGSNDVNIVNSSDTARPQSEGGWYGTLNGTIVDPVGAVVPAVKVTLVEEQTKQELTTTTDSEGGFQFPSLSSGVYSLKTEAAQGFAAAEVRDIKLPSADGSSAATLNVGVPVAETSLGNVIITLPLIDTSVQGGAMLMVGPSDALVSAAFKDDLQAVRELIAAGVDVNVVDGEVNETALMEAVSHGNREMVQALLGAGADVNARNSYGRTALMSLSDKTTPEMVWDLISAGAKVNRKASDGNTALMMAAAVDNVSVLQSLIDAGARVNAHDANGKTALIWAAEGGNVENVRALLRAGALVNRKTSDDETALSLALENEHPEIVELLKGYGARE